MWGSWDIATAPSACTASLGCCAWNPAASSAASGWAFCAALAAWHSSEDRLEDQAPAREQ